MKNKKKRVSKIKLAQIKKNFGEHNVRKCRDSA